MDWVELPRKGRNTITILQEFEKCFARMSTLIERCSRQVKTLDYFSQWWSARREKVNSLIENEDLITMDWVMVRRASIRFDKRHQWYNKTSTRCQMPTRRETHLQWVLGAPERKRSRKLGTGAYDKCGGRTGQRIDHWRTHKDGMEGETVAFPLKIGILQLAWTFMWCDNPGHLQRECEIPRGLAKKCSLFCGCMKMIASR